MIDTNNSKIGNPFPFRVFCQKVIPLAFDESMSYLELLYSLLHYLKETVIPAVNNNADAVTELQNLYNELKSYVDNYFENLDIQTEINNKLDEMATDGTLENIINQKIFQELNEKIDNINNTINEKSQIHFIANKTISEEQNSFVGDCSLITGTKNILIDIGNQRNAQTLLNYLQEKNITKLDYIIISHYHDDHIGGTNAEGFLALITESNIDFSECKVILPHKNINYSRFVPNSTENVFRTREQLIIQMLTNNNISYEFATENQKIQISDNEELNFYNSDIDYYNDYYNYTLDAFGNDVGYTNYNNFSLITIYKHFNNSIAFTGDIEKLAQSKNYQHFKNIDLLKVEHHGLNCESDLNYLNQLNPKFAVICNSQYYDNPADFAHPTIFQVTSKGAKLFTTRNANKTIIFDSEYNGLSCENDTKTNLHNMQYDLWSGQEILDGDDLNDYIIPGVYNCNNGKRTQSLQNVPTTLSGRKLPGSGFKLIVENLNGYNNYIRQLIIPSNDNGVNTFYIRDTFEGSFENTHWTIVTPSLNIGTLNTTEIENLNWWKVSHTAYSVRLIKKNGIVQLNVLAMINQNVAERNVLLEIPSNILKTSSQSAYFRTADNNFTQIYTNGTDNVTQIKNTNAITSGTIITFSITLISEE